MTIPGKTVYLLKFKLSQDIIICIQVGIQTHNLWIRSPTRLSIAPRRNMCCGMIGFSIYISCYNFPISIAYFNCILKIYSSEDISCLPWPNWLARSAVNRKVGVSSPSMSDFLSTQHIHLHTFLRDHYFGSYGCLNTIEKAKRQLIKKSRPDARYSPI